MVVKIVIDAEVLAVVNAMIDLDRELVATVRLARSPPTSRRVAVASCSFELAGVLIVGTASLIDKDAFPDATVWSTYGVGYGFVPLVLPILGLLWLRFSRPTAKSAEVA